MLKVDNLRVKVKETFVLNGLSMYLSKGETVAIMGPNGSGKTSLAYTIMGHPKYEVVEENIIYKDQDIISWKTEERAKAGIFLSFQYPVAIPGVTVTQLIKTAYKSVKDIEVNPREMLNNLKNFSKELEFDEKLLKDFTSMLNKNFKYAIEVRNKTFIDDRFFDILKKENIAFCIADSAGRYPYYEAITSDFVYIRLHGSKKLYTSEYTEKELSEWAIKIKNWKMPTFIYFDNDFKGFAVKNALQLRNYLHSEDEKIGQTPSGC